MPKKLIEVSLPLEAINREAAREKSIRHGHPSTLHLWWARRPLAACRAVLFASLVDDPSEYMPDEESARVERERLFHLIEELVKWENSNNEEVLDKARLEIARSVARTLNVDPPVGREAVREFLATKAPPVLDPFAGGGSIPLEAQRLGLRAYASDLNPVAVLINKALIEIPPKFANMPPVHPPEESPSPKVGRGARGEGRQPSLFTREWKGAQGLAEDVRYYGKWMRDEAFKRIGHLYPPVTITEEMLAERPDLKEQGLKPGDQLTVIAWLWARTVKCPNPACGAQMPLANSFMLSTKQGKNYWIEPLVRNTKPKTIDFTIRYGKGGPSISPKVSRGANFQCLACGQVSSDAHIKSEGKAGRLGSRLLAIVADTGEKRIYLPPVNEHENIVRSIHAIWRPEFSLSYDRRAIWCPIYGLDTFDKLFTERQLVALATFSDLIREVINKIQDDIKKQNGIGYQGYTNAVATYLAFGVNRLSNTLTTIARWTASREQTVTAFARQGIPMTWDYPDVNPFANAAGDLIVSLESITNVLENLPCGLTAIVSQSDARTISNVEKMVLSTDPPYYDNIGYADLSDFFYVWLRHMLAEIYPTLFTTMLVPKNAELVASAYRFNGNKKAAEEFFEKGLREVFLNMRGLDESSYPTTVYYAFKQSEDNKEEDKDFRSSTGWETMLSSLLNSSYQITGTWPMRTEMENRSVGQGVNALASSIVLVCRPRPQNAPSCSRREFLAALKKELAPALRELQQGSIAPVDLAQAAIGPGMAVFSRYSAVLEADGSPMSVRTALALINQALDEYLAEQEGEYDADTRWALAWFEQFGHNEAPFGVAETLSKAKNTSVNGLAEAGILEARGGKVRLLRRDELSPSPRGRGARGEGGEVWDPLHDKRPTAWEAVQHLIHALESQGEAPAAELLTKLGAFAAPARDLAYRLYTVCERKGWAQDALGYNMLVVAWPRLKELAARQAGRQEKLI